MATKTFHSLCITAAVVALAACTTINVPPTAADATATPATGAAPIVDALNPAATQTTPAAATTAASAPATATAPAATAPALTGLNLQAGSFANTANAERVATDIRTKVPKLANSVHVVPVGEVFRVIIGPFADNAARQAAAANIRTATGKDVVNASK